LISILIALNGVAALIVAFNFFGGGPVGSLGVVVQAVFGIALLYLSYGVWTMQEWAWLATIIIEGLNGLYGLIGVILTPLAITAWVSFGLAIVIVAYLLQPGVRQVFEQRRPAH